jgi:RNA polymerase sigma-70 factor (ECF subfamily)
MAEPDTGVLLQSWHAGDRAALDALVRDNLAWIHEHVRRRLGPALRKRADSQDLVQETLLGLLRDGPRFVLSDQVQFRALMVRMIENVILRQVEFHSAKRRDAAREVPPVSRDTVLPLDPAYRPVTQPSDAAAAGEMRALVALALELIEPDDRAVILAREFHGRSFGEIATEFGIGEDAARMRFSRALPRLAEKLRHLRNGSIAAALQGSE